MRRRAHFFGFAPFRGAGNIGPPALAGGYLLRAAGQLNGALRAQSGAQRGRRTASPRQP